MEGKAIVTGGVMDFQKITKKIQDKNPALYELGKIIAWQSLLERGMMPIRWNKPTRNGTRVKFSMVDSEEKAKQAVAELEEYITKANEEYGGPIDAAAITGIAKEE